MAKTLVSDVLVPSIFEDYVIERSVINTSFGQSDIIEVGPQYDALISDGGKIVSMPAWKQGTVSLAARQLISDSGSFSVNSINTSTDVARIHNDGNAWSVTLLAALLAGDDPMMAIADFVATYWTEIDQSIVIASVKGIIGALDAVTGDPNLLAIHSESIAAQTSATKLNGSTFVDAVQKLGDANRDLVAISMHSATEAALKKQDLIDYLPDSEGKPTIAVFQGRRVIITDQMPTRAGSTDGVVYTSVLYGPGVFGFGNQRLNEPLSGGFGTKGVELSRVSLAHDDVLINRRRWIKHPRGFQWNDTTGGATADGGATDAQLATAARWTPIWVTGYDGAATPPVYVYKNIRFVGITHNN